MGTPKPRSPKKQHFTTGLLCYNVILLYTTKFRVNPIITRWDIAKRRFSIWRPFAILSLQNFSILLSSRPWKHNLHPKTKFRSNRMTTGWDIAIKLFSKWRPSAILHCRNSVFWSYNLCYKAILLYPTKFRVNRVIIRWDIAKRRFSIWRPSAILDSLWRHHTSSGYSVLRS